MKTSVAALLAVIGYAGAGRPQFSVKVRNGSFDGIDALDPTVRWSTSAKSGDMDLDYGIEADLRATSDIGSLPRKIWGKANRDISGWGVSARADVDAQDLKTADLELDADNQENDLSVHVVAQAGDEFYIRRVEATKGFDADGARVTVTPRMNLDYNESDVVITYNSDKTNLKLTASADSQELTISRQIDDDNRIAPTIRSDGDISVEWEHRLGDDNTLTANLKPNKSLGVEWKDADWTTNVNMPIDGTHIKGANVSIKRDVDF